MNRYWITLSGVCTNSLRHGLGVTARSERDAKEIVLAVLGQDAEIVAIKRIEDMREVECDGVFPLNIGNHFQRGVWFPMGLEEWWPVMKDESPPAAAGGWLTRLRDAWRRR